MNYIVLDIETTGLNPLCDKIHGVGISYPDGRVEYTKGGLSAEAKLWLKNPAAHVVGHNLRFDLKFLAAAGYEIRAQEWDTKILAQLLNENQQLGLKPLSEKYFGVGSLDNKRELDRAISLVKGKSVADLCIRDIDSGYTSHYDIISEYCIEDCINTRNLFDKLVADIKIMDQKLKSLGYKKTPLNYYVEEAMPLEKVLRSMELSGIKIDLNALVRYKEQLIKENDELMVTILENSKKEIEQVENDLYEEVKETKKSDKGKANVLRSSAKHKTKFNWQSADHIRRLVFEKFGASRQGVDTTDSGLISTSETSLAFICGNETNPSRLRRTLEAFGKWKKNLKLLTMYTGEDKGLLAQVINERIHSEYLQAGHGKNASDGGTVTGRLSSRSPNMQNLPRGSEVKRFFKPDPGHVFIYFDYSQLELRLAAHLSKDPLLLRAYQQGLDLHQQTATALGESRQMGKTINFAMIYDASKWRLAEILEKSPEDCEIVIENFYSVYLGYAKYLEDQKKAMSRQGWVISEMGRLRRLPELKTERFGSKGWNHALKQGYNFPVQSLGASVTKRTMIELHKRGYKIVTQVHDSVVCQVPEAQAHAALQEITSVAENIWKGEVPIKVDAKILTSLHEEDKVKESTHESSSNNRQNQSSNSSVA